MITSPVAFSGNSTVINTLSPTLTPSASTVTLMSKSILETLSIAFCSSDLKLPLSDSKTALMMCSPAVKLLTMRLTPFCTGYFSASIITNAFPAAVSL